MALDPIMAMMRPASKEDELRALADTLRKRKRAADFYSISTIKPLQQMGQASGEQVMATAERQGVLREALAQREAEKAQKEADRAAELEAARVQREFEAGENVKDRASEERRALVRTLGKGGGVAEYNAPKTQKEREKFDKGGREAAAFNSLAASFKPEYTASIPLMGNAENFLGRKFEALAPESLTEQAKWWADYKEQAELVRRHELFGAALTKTEQDQWERAMITPNDGPEFIAQKLETQRALANKIAEHEAALALQKNYDPKQVLMNFGDAVDVESLAARVADGSYFTELASRQAAERGKKPAIAKAAKALSDYTDEELEAMSDEELEALAASE